MKLRLTPMVKMIRQSAESRGTRGPSPSGEWQICCPWCDVTTGKTDTKYKLSVNIRLGLFHCYRCGTSGAGSFAWLGGAPSDEHPQEKLATLGPPESFVPFTSDGKGLPTSMAPAVVYLKKRHAYKAAVSAGAGYCYAGKYAGRVVLPVWPEDVGPRGLKTLWLGTPRNWAGFTARTIFPDVEPRYLYPPGMNRRATLWNMDTALQSRAAVIWLVEGVFDALALYPNAIATFGKAVTETQIDWLVEEFSAVPWHTAALRGVLGKLVVCLDGDAWEDGQVLACRLGLRGLAVDWCRLPPGTDPGVLGAAVSKYIQTD